MLVCLKNHTVWNCLVSKLFLALLLLQSGQLGNGDRITKDLVFNALRQVEGKVNDGAGQLSGALNNARTECLTLVEP